MFSLLKIHLDLKQSQIRLRRIWDCFKVSCQPPLSCVSNGAFIGATKKLEQDRVLNSNKYHPEYEIEIELENGNKLKVDKKHPIYINKNGKIKEIEAQHLKENDDIVTFANFN